MTPISGYTAIIIGSNMKSLKVFSLVCVGVLVGLIGMTRLARAEAPLPVAQQPIHVIGRMTVTLDQQERFEYEKLTKVLFQQTILKDKPKLYTCNEDIYSIGTFVWDEVWSSKEALDKHLASDHFKAWWSWVEPHLSGSLEVLYDLQSDLKKV